METTSKPRYNLWQNTAFMLREAWHTRKSVIFLCVTLAAATAGQSVAELLIAPVILQKVEQAAALPELLGAILCLGGMLALLAALVVPQLVQSVTTFAGRLGAYEETIRGLLVWVQNTFGIDTATAEQLVQMVGTALQNWFGGLSRSAARAAADFVSGAAGAVGNAVVALAASIYLLSGKEALLRAARACLHAALPPRAAGSVLEICRLANKIFSGYIGGQLVDALLVGGETFALMSIFGLEYAPLLAVLVGVTNIVPVLGPFLGAVPGLIILLLELPWKAAEFAIIIFVVQQVDGNFIAPRILGGATGLPGLGVLLAIVVGGAWFGIPGMVLGVPTLAVLAALLKQAVGAGLTARGLDENGEPRRNLPGGPQEN